MPIFLGNTGRGKSKFYDEKLLYLHIGKVDSSHILWKNRASLSDSFDRFLRAGKIVVREIFSLHHIFDLENYLLYSKLI
jgi:hypothetical protein